MSVALSNPLPPRAAYTDEPVFRLTTDQYHELIRLGKLTADDPVELLEGILLFKRPKNTPHSTATRLCRRAVEPRLPVGWFYDSQEPITLPDGEPEPDGIVVRGTIEDYLKHHPGARDLALVIEVSDTTIDRDRGIKLRSYARAGVSAYWILDLNQRVLEVYSDPQPNSLPDPTFRNHQHLTETQSITLLFDGKPSGELSIATLLPPPE